MNTTILKAIEVCGNQANLAKECQVTQATVSIWLNGGGIKAIYIPRIVKATNGQVTADEIFAELNRLSKE